MRAPYFAVFVLGFAATVAAQQKPAAAVPAQKPAPAAPKPAVPVTRKPAPAVVPTAADAPPLEKATTPAGAPVASPPPGPAAAVPPPPENYAYEPAGRRDPFLSLIGTGTDPLITSRRPDGAAGLMVNEITVSGIVNSRGALVAAVQGPDRKTYLVRQGDKLLDGTVKAVTAEGLTIVQDVNDPLSIVKQREVQKLLRSLEAAK